MIEFGKTDCGIDCSLFTIENETIKASVTDYGGTLVSLVYKPKGIDVIQGFDDVQGYIHKVPYMGAVVGRTCNRTANGTFMLNEMRYYLPINDKCNSLHGGKVGFSMRMFHVLQEENRLVLFLHSDDGDQGYPGNLDLKIVYELTDKGLRFSYSGVSDRDTLLSVTNHAFFNLDGSDSIDHHKLQINASEYALLDENELTLDHTEAVGGTPFDFRIMKEIGRDINSSDPQIQIAHGYDHHFAVDGKGMRKMLVCQGSEIKMTVTSDLPGFHLYTSNYLNFETGKYGSKYPPHSSVCFETQYYPNAVNCLNQLKPILYSGKEMLHSTEYTFESI